MLPPVLSEQTSDSKSPSFTAGRPELVRSPMIVTVPPEIASIVAPLALVRRWRWNTVPSESAPDYAVAKGRAIGSRGATAQGGGGAIFQIGSGDIDRSAVEGFYRAEISSGGVGIAGAIDVDRIRSRRRQLSIMPELAGA